MTALYLPFHCKLTIIQLKKKKKHSPDRKTIWSLQYGLQGHSLTLLASTPSLILSSSLFHSLGSRLTLLSLVHWTWQVLLSSWSLQMLLLNTLISCPVTQLIPIDVLDVTVYVSCSETFPEPPFKTKIPLISFLYNPVIAFTGAMIIYYYILFTQSLYQVVSPLRTEIVSILLIASSPEHTAWYIVELKYSLVRWMNEYFIPLLLLSGIKKDFHEYWK